MKNLRLFLTVFVAVFVGFFSALSLAQIEIKPIKFENKASGQEQVDFLKDVLERVKKEYVEEKTDRQLAEAAASGILSSLDPHSSYLNEDALKEMRVQTKGEFGAIDIDAVINEMRKSRYPGEKDLLNAERRARYAAKKAATQT
jgi:carboxyl-terminal processing protease